MKKQLLVIGIGTGRCGTTSLARLLNAQSEFCVSHEFKDPDVENGYAYLTYKGTGAILPWKPDKESVFRVEQELRSRSCPVVGDVAFYHLPYIEDYYMKSFDEVKVISIKRNREDTIESYTKWVQKRNHWMSHDGSTWRHDTWDRCFPVFDQAESKEDAIGRYWDAYYKKVDGLSCDVYHMNMLDLNDEEAVNDLLTNFLNINNPATTTGIQANTSKYHIDKIQD